MRSLLGDGTGGTSSNCSTTETKTSLMCRIIPTRPDGEHVGEHVEEHVGDHVGEHAGQHVGEHAGQHTGEHVGEHGDDNGLRRRYKTEETSMD